MLCMLLLSGTLAAQNVIRKGDTFEQVSKKKKSAEQTKTKYVYQTADGKKYPIYLSANGKYFIYRISKNGKTYKQYLPEVQKQLLCGNQDKL